MSEKKTLNPKINSVVTIIIVFVLSSMYFFEINILTIA